MSETVVENKEDISLFAILEHAYIRDHPCQPDRCGICAALREAVNRLHSDK